MKKKHYIGLNKVIDFFKSQNEGINKEYKVIINILELEGRLTAPLGEKVNKTLFAIRIIQTGNVRVFYLYGKENYIYGIHAYVKKSKEIPIKEIKIATKIAKELKKENLI
jgi:phage-related protein